MDIEKTLHLLLEKLEGWLQAFILILPNLLIAVLIIGIFAIATKVLRRVLAGILGRLSGSEPLNRLAITVASLLVMSFGLLTALSILHLDKTVMSLLAGVGVVGLALGFAFQDIAANFMAGLLILLRRPLRIGNIVKSNEFFGKVTAMDLRNTVIRTWSGQDVLIPNKQVFQSPLVNYSRSSDRRLELAVGVSYGDDLRKVADVTREAVRELPHRDPSREPEIFFTEFGSSSINFELRVWLDTPEQKAYFEARSAAIMQIKSAFDAHDVTIPFPIRTLDFGIKGGESLSETLLDLGSLETSNGSRAAAQPSEGRSQ